MGFAGISPGSLMLILAILLLVLGGKRVRNLGEDLGKAVKSFKRGMKEVESKEQDDGK